PSLPIIPPHHSHAFSLCYSRHHPDLHSFPTRRSSDLYVDDRSGPDRLGNRLVGRDRQLGGRAAAESRIGARRHDERLWHVQCAGDRKSTRLNSSHVAISYAVFCLKKKKTRERETTTRL